MNILVCGTQDEGKTTLARWLARQRHSCVVDFDPKGDIPGHVVYSAEELEQALDNECWRGKDIVYRYDMASTEAKDAFANMMSVLWDYGGYALMIDESAELQSWASIDPLLKKTVAQHCKRPPERSVTVIQTNHRLPEFNGKVKTVMAELYTFRTNNPRDLDILLDYSGDPSLSDIVRVLPRHHCVRVRFARQDNGVPQWELWDDPSVWYVPMNDVVIPAPARERSLMERIYGQKRTFGGRVDTGQTITRQGG